MKESSMVWMALALFCLIKVAVPWQFELLDLADQEQWWPLLWHLAITLGLAITVWRMFENDGMVLILTLVWLLGGPMYRAVSLFMEVANAPPGRSTTLDRGPQSR